MTHDHYNNRKNQLLLAFAIALLIYYFAGCSVAYGQDTLRIDSSMWIGKTHGIYIPISPNDIKWGTKRTKPKTQWMTLAEYWEGYKNALDSVYKYEVNRKINLWLECGYDFEVIHFEGGVTLKYKIIKSNFYKEKPTLDGFMEYLENK